MDSRVSRYLPYLAFALLALFPLTESTFYMQLLTKVLIMAIFAMSLDLLAMPPTSASPAMPWR